MGSIILQTSVATTATLAVTLIMLMVPAVISDLRYRRIPNLVPAIGITLAWLIPIGDSNLLLPAISLNLVAGALLIGGLVMPLYLLDILGAGDIKLLTMVGAFLGPALGMQALIGSFVIGGLLAVAWLQSGRGSRTLPYAVAIAGGTLASLVTAWV